MAQMSALTEAIREKRVLVKHVPGHTGHGLQESSDSVSKMHRHFPGQIVDKRHQSEFNQRCESIIKLWLVVRSCSPACAGVVAD